VPARPGPVAVVAGGNLTYVEASPDSHRQDVAANMQVTREDHSGTQKNHCPNMCAIGRPGSAIPFAMLVPFLPATAR